MQAPPSSEPPADAQKPDRVFENGHLAAVTALAFSPDGRWIASGSQDKTIRIWDVTTGHEQRVLKGHSNPVTALAFSPDGQWLASSSEDGTVRVWDPATGTSNSTFSLGAGFAEDVVFSPDGRFLVASAAAADEGGNSVIAIHDAISGEKIHAITVEWNNATPVLITPDGRILSSGGAGEDGEYVSTKVWELKSGRELKSLPVLVMAFTADGHWGVSVEYKHGPHINLWDITTGQHVRTITVPYVNVARVAFTPDGTEIMVAKENGSEIKFYETASGKEIRTLPLAVGAVAFSSDGKWLAGSSGSSVKIWDLSGTREPQTLAGQLGARDVAFSPDGKLLITGADALGVWDVTSGKLIKTLASGTQSLAYSREGQWLVTNPGGKLEVWSARTWTLAAISPPQSAYIWWMGFGPDQPPRGDLARSGVKWWQVDDGVETRSLWGATYPAALSPDGTLLATAAARGGVVSIWDTASGQVMQTFVAHDVGVNTVAFSPDGKWFLTAGQESRIDPANFAASMANLKHSIKLWEVGTWQERLALPFTGMTGGFSGFSPDGHMLAVGRADSISTTLYSVPDGRELKTLAGGGAGRLSFSPDGLWVAQGFNLWNLGSPGNK